MIYGYVSVWLFCDIVPGQPDAAAAAMKMCLSVIRLFNLSGGTGLSVSLTLANPPDLGLIHSRITCAPSQNICNLSEEIFLNLEKCHIHQTGTPVVGEREVWQTCGLVEAEGENSEMGLIFETPPSILLTQQKFKLDTKEGGCC